MSNSIFSVEAPTEGKQPHMIQFLWQEYLKELEAGIEKRQQAGQLVLTLAEAARKAPATAFCAFCARYLQEHRVVENFFVDMNHGVRLSNNKSFVVCPSTDIQGTMQSEDRGVNITQGRSQAGNESIVPFDPFPI